MLVFRKLLAHETGCLTQHLQRLDAADRRLRFGHFVTSEVIATYVASIHWPQTWVVGAFDGDTLRGVAELRPCGPSAARQAELSVTVERGYQNRGIGTRLLEEALLIARNRAFETLYLLCLPENMRMQHIARKLGDLIRFHDGDVEARIKNPHPDLLSLLTEVFGDGLVFWQAAWKAASHDGLAPAPRKLPLLP